MFGRNYRTLPVERVLEQIDKSGARTFFVYDDNFGVRKKDEAVELMDGLRKMRVRWSAQVDVRIANDEEFLELMRKSGCTYVYIGLESVNDKTL